jgi:PAS domain S-box-containing protein
VKVGNPMNEEVTAHSTPAGPGGAPANAEGAPPRRILLVEDNPGDADLVRAALEEAAPRLQLEHVERVQAALARLAAGGIDAVLLDLSLPDALGLQSVERIHGAHPTVPLVVLTSSSRFAREALRAGAQDYMGKDGLDGRGIERAIEYALERKLLVERERELSAERAAREAIQASAALLERTNQQLALALSEAREARERESAARLEAESRQRELEALFGSMADGVIVFGVDDRISAVNDAAAALFGADLRGLGRAELLERACMRSGDGSGLTPETMPSARALDGAVVCSERLRVRTPGGERTLLVSASPLRRGGTVSGSISVYRDVTDAEGALREANRRKDEFLGMLSHELRNPLAPIRNSLYILGRAAPGGEQARRALQVIERQVQHTTRLVDDLLDVTRISRGKVRMQRERLDLVELARGTMEDHRALFVKNGITLEARHPRDPILVYADPSRVAQVIGNLLQNAVKFTPRGGRTTISVERDEGFGVVTVRDTGVGIAPDVLSRLFEPFVQAERTLARSAGGLGLGLALVKGLVELQGGSVSAHSEGIGRGATLVVRLPLERRRAARSKPAASEPALRPTRHVLVVEDNIDAAESLKEALELNDHRVEIALSGTEGVERARAMVPDVILCDIGLPGMDGFEVAKVLRATPELRDVVLIALSGYAQPEDLERSRDAGFDLHLAKPPVLEALERAMVQVRSRAAGTSLAGAAPPLGG